MFRMTLGSTDFLLGTPSRPRSSTDISMTCTNPLEPCLPPELERLIFELALAENDTKASTLLLVAKRVREWIRPHKFRVVNQILRRHSPDFNYLPQLLQSVGPFVQYLTIESLSTAESLKLRAILSSCPNVRNLVIYPPSPVGRPSLNYLLPALQGMPHLTHLTAALLSVPYDKFLTLPFLNLTHLAILLPNGRSWEGEWKVLTHLPKLTHLSVEFFVQVDIILHLLLFCPLLKLLTVIPYHEMDPYELCGYRVDDNRFVQLVGLTYADRILDWERGANGGMDKWKFSELVIFARGRKYFSKRLPTWIPRNLDWEKYLNEEGKNWFSELRINYPYCTEGNVNWG